MNRHLVVSFFAVAVPCMVGRSANAEELRVATLAPRDSSWCSPRCAPGRPFAKVRARLAHGAFSPDLVKRVEKLGGK